MAAKSKTHTTNYFNTFIEIAEDTNASSAAPPPEKNPPTVAQLQYGIIASNPYKYTSDEVLFQVHAQRKDLAREELPAAREAFFSKGQPCLRTSPLAKTYGFGIHCNAAGKVALVKMDSPEYQQFLKDASVQKVKAMRSGKSASSTKWTKSKAPLSPEEKIVGGPACEKTVAARTKTITKLLRDL